MLTHFLAQSDTIKHLNEQAADGSSQLLLGVNGSARAASVAALYEANQIGRAHV